MQMHVEVKDRRFGLRLYPAVFVRAEAVKWLQTISFPAPDEFLQQCVREGSVVCALQAGDVEWCQFVPRVIHAGFVYVGGPGNWVRRWATLRETTLQLHHDSKRQLVSELDLLTTTANEVLCSSTSSCNGVLVVVPSFFLFFQWRLQRRRWTASSLL